MNKKKHQSGYSLIELMIVVAILGILFTLAADGVRHSIQKAEKAAIVGTAHAIQLELDARRSAMGYFPETLDGLLPGLDPDEWSYGPERGLGGHGSSQGPRGLAGSGDDPGRSSGSSEPEGINPNGENVTGWFLMTRRNLFPMLNIDFGWMTGGGMALRFEPLFSPAAGSPVEGGDDGGDGTAAIPDPCDRVPAGDPVPQECSRPD